MILVCLRFILHFTMIWLWEFWSCYSGWNAWPNDPTGRRFLAGYFVCDDHDIDMWSSNSMWPNHCEMSLDTRYCKFTCAAGVNPAWNARGQNILKRRWQTIFFTAGYMLNVTTLHWKNNTWPSVLQHPRACVCCETLLSYGDLPAKLCGYVSKIR